MADDLIEEPVAVRRRVRKPRLALPVVTEPAGEPAPPAAAPAEAAEDLHMATTINPAMFADLNGRAGEAMAQGTRFAEEMSQFGRANLDAMIESGRIAIKGWEQIGQHAADYARRQFEGAQEAARTVAQAKSPTEAMRMSGELARTAFDQFVAEAARSTEVAMKLAGEVAQPVANRVAVAVDKMKVAV
jgi:phasin family protein